MGKIFPKHYIAYFGLCNSFDNGCLFFQKCGFIGTPCKSCYIQNKGIYILFFMHTKSFLQRYQTKDKVPQNLRGSFFRDNCRIIGRYRPKILVSLALPIPHASHSHFCDYFDSGKHQRHHDCHQPLNQSMFHVCHEVQGCKLIYWMIEIDGHKNIKDYGADVVIYFSFMYFPRLQLLHGYLFQNPTSL